MSDETELPTETHASGADATPASGPALAVLWCDGLARPVGSVIPVPGGGPVLIGRGGARADDPAPRAFPVQMRPGRTEPLGALTLRRLSRAQLLVEAASGGVRVRNIGRAAMLHGDQQHDDRVFLPGEVLRVHRSLVLLVTERPATLPEFPLGVDRPRMPFGEADAHGLVGESPRMWELRQHLSFVAGRADHVLLQGPSGVGKELVARALAGRGPWVARNAATLPPGLVDAELFGNKRNYPNPGMAERRGLIGEADGGTLFLDELGELPHAAQASLLRVLDSGEYQRLGEDHRRRASFRLIAATNRAVTELKHDVAARLRHRLVLPDLNERREDVPLLIRCLFARIAEGDARIRGRFLSPDGPRVSAELVARLAGHPYTTHVRELETLLWDSMMRSRGDVLDHLPEALLEAQTPDAPAVDPAVDRLRRVLADTAWNVSEAARRLDLSRYQLIRLLKKHGLQRPG